MVIMTTYTTPFTVLRFGRCRSRSRSKSRGKSSNAEDDLMEETRTQEPPMANGNQNDGEEEQRD